MPVTHSLTRQICASILLLAALSPMISARGDLSATRPVYTTTQPSDDGIGKVYLGREIAFVMGHQGIHWLERPTRELEEQPRKAIELMELKDTDVVGGKAAQGVPEL